MRSVPLWLAFVLLFPAVVWATFCDYSSSSSCEADTNCEWCVGMRTDVEYVCALDGQCPCHYRNNQSLCESFTTFNCSWCGNHCEDAGFCPNCSTYSNSESRCRAAVNCSWYSHNGCFPTGNFTGCGDGFCAISANESSRSCPIDCPLSLPFSDDFDDAPFIDPARWSSVKGNSSTPSSICSESASPDGNYILFADALIAGQIVSAALNVSGLDVVFVSYWLFHGGSDELSFSCKSASPTYPLEFQASWDHGITWSTIAAFTNLSADLYYSQIQPQGKLTPLTLRWIQQSAAGPWSLDRIMVSANGSAFAMTANVLSTGDASLTRASNSIGANTSLSTTVATSSVSSSTTYVQTSASTGSSSAISSSAAPTSTTMATNGLSTSATSLSPPTVIQLESSSESSTATLIIAACAIAVLLVAAIAIACVFVKRERQIISSSHTELSTAASDSTEPAIAAATSPHRDAVDYLQGITLREVIGRGHFGTVFLGTWASQDVAIKQLKSGSATDVAAELSVLERLNHPYIVRFYGVCDIDFARGGGIGLVTEYCPQGGLDAVLKGRDFGVDALVVISFQVASGLAFLASKGVVHRDLAARNVLLDANGIAKLSDFGLSRFINDDEIYEVSSQAPVRWSAPEVFMDKVATPKSDVYMLGITIWEIFSKGARPFSDIKSNAAVVVAVVGGERPSKPDSMPTYLFAIIEQCWAAVPDDRLTASAVVEHLSLQAAVALPESSRALSAYDLSAHDHIYHTELAEGSILYQAS